ncbi:MAG: TonB-dependent receptor [Bacteroidota bacterium]
MTRLLLLSLLLATTASAQTVEGVVSSDGETIPLATVRVVDTALGTAANADGEYRITLPEAGTYALRFTAVGYAPEDREVAVAAGETVMLNVELAAATLDAGAIVVTGTLEQLGVRESPVKVDVLPAAFLKTTPSVNIMEVIGRVNGLYEQIDCGVCYTNNIRINGIDGPNTAVLIDGAPVMSSLAMVYGLNGISPILIDQIEVVKGPMSTLYGSEALGGVINIITKDPATTPTLSSNVFTTTRGDVAGEIAVVPLRGQTNALLSGTVLYNDAFQDNNNDGFSDFTQDTRLSLFGKLTQSDAQGFERASLIAKGYYEDRAAGLASFFDNVSGLRGSDEIYGESIYTRRGELIGSLNLRPDLKLQASAAYHDQDSFYGDTGYEATQADGFGQLIYTPETEGTTLDGHNILVGAALRAIRYDDNSGATGLFDEDGNLLENTPDDRIVPGLFVQDDWRVSEQLRLLGGFRADLQPNYGVIPSPRAAVKFQPTVTTTARLNVGTGFRIVNLFTEDHSAYSGSRATLIVEDLEPERSVSATASVQQIIGSQSPVTVDLDVFWTEFSNKIEPDYSVPGEIRYENLDDGATTRGVSLQVQGALGRNVRYAVGGTLLDVFVEGDDGVTRPLEFAADYLGSATVTWDAPAGLEFDYTTQLTGPMRMPEYGDEVAAEYEAATGEPLLLESPVYSIHNVQIKRDFQFGGQLATVLLAVENVLDYTQPSPLVGYYDGNPGFGETFDTAYVYGPIVGRRFTAGVRLTLP